MGAIEKFMAKFTKNEPLASTASHEYQPVPSDKQKKITDYVEKPTKFGESLHRAWKGENNGKK